MLVIRKTQIEALLKSQEDSFIDRMKVHLRSEFPKEISGFGIKDKDLEMIIRKGLTDAYQYRIIYENDLILYIECIAVLGPDFDKKAKYPAVIEILNRDDLDGSAKMDKLSDYLTFELNQSL